MGFKKIWDRLNNFYKGFKRVNKTARESGFSRLHVRRKYNEQTRKMDRLANAWPELPNLFRQAKQVIKENGKKSMYESILRNLNNGTANWLPKEKRVEIKIYILLRLANTPISEEKIGVLGLEKHVGSLNRFIELY